MSNVEMIMFICCFIAIGYGVYSFFDYITGNK